MLFAEMNDWWLKNTGTSITGPIKPKDNVVDQPEVFISYQWGKQKEVKQHMHTMIVEYSSIYV